MVKKDLYLYVYNFIKQHQRLPKDISKQKAYYYTKQLRESELIEKLPTGIWRVTGKKLVQKQVKVAQRKTRGHGFVFKVSINNIYNWDRRRIEFNKKGLHWSKIKYGERIFVLGHKLNIYDNAIMIYFSSGTSFYGVDGEESSFRAMVHCKEILKRLEKDVGVSLRVGKGWLVQEVRSHYADVNNVCAKYYKSKGINYLPIVMNGKTWALIDNSMNLFELETILGHGQSKDDIGKLQDFLNDLKTNPTTISKTKDDLINLLYISERNNQERDNQVKALQEQLRSQTLLTTTLTQNVMELTNFIKSHLHK